MPQRLTTAIIVALFAVLGVGVGAPTPLAQPQGFASLAASVRIEPPLDFCGEAVPLDVPDVRERLEKELLLSLWNRAQVVLWLKRAQRYFPHIEQVLAQNGLPDDLKYVVVVESALRPHARSTKGAVGYWQFMPATGRRYGLRIDRDVDQRRNLFASTAAAARYLGDLYARFGAWTLAAAAYNTGEDRLDSEILLQETDDFYHLYLHLETQRYILKAVAAKLIFSDPQRYGFVLTPEDKYAPLEFDTVEIECRQRTPIALVARAANTYFKVIKDLNPEIRGYHLEKGRHRIGVPLGAADGFHPRYRRLLSESAAGEKIVYVIKKGDNLSAIAQRFNVPLNALLTWNRLNGNQPIHPGERLTIYPRP